MIELRSPTGLDVPAAVAITHGSLGLHAGIAFSRAGGPDSIVHLAFHHRLVFEDLVSWDGLWVVPNIEAEHLTVLAMYCEGVLAVEQPIIPYSFRYTEGRLNSVGQYVGGTDHGLTCATFVLAVIAAATGMELVDCATWEARPEDIPWHRALLDLLESWRRRGKVSEKHLDAVRAETGCARFRPEEVAAASASSHDRPVSWAVCVPEGVDLLRLFCDRVPRGCETTGG